MKPQLLQEWVELRTKTWEHLRSRGHILQPKNKPILQLLVMPSFDDTWCLDILETAGILSAYRTTWYSSQDVLAFEAGIARLRYPRPFLATLSSVKIDRSEAEVRWVLDVLESVRFPSDWKDNSISLDGTNYEYQYGEWPPTVGGSDS